MEDWYRTWSQRGFHTITERFLRKDRQPVAFEKPDPSLPTMEIPPSLVLEELSQRTWRAKVVHEAVRKGITWLSICKDELPRWLIRKPRSTDILYDARVMYFQAAAVETSVEALVRRQIAHNGILSEADIGLLRANVENDLADPGNLETAVESLGLSRVPEAQDRHLITKKWSEATLGLFLAGWAVAGGVCTLAPLTQNPNQRLSPEQVIDKFRQEHLQAQIKRSQLEAQKPLAQPSLSRWEFNGLGRDGLPASLLGAAQAETMKHFGLNPEDDGDVSIFLKIWDTNATVKHAVFETVRDAKSVNPTVLDPHNPDRLSSSASTTVAFDHTHIKSLKPELVLHFTSPDEQGHLPSAKGAIEAVIMEYYFGLDPLSKEDLGRFETARESDPLYSRMFKEMYDLLLARNPAYIRNDEITVGQNILLPTRPLLEALHEGKQQLSSWAKKHPDLVFIFFLKAENQPVVKSRTPAQDKIRHCAQNQGESLEQFLQREYKLEGKTMEQIAKLTSSSRRTVGRLLKKYGIESRGKKRAV